MKKFSLEYLLKLRDLARRQQQSTLAECQVAIAEIESQLMRVEQPLREAKERPALTASGGLTKVFDVKANYEFIRGLEVRQQQLKDELSELAKRLEKEREVFQQVDRDAKALEKLRKRHAMAQLRSEARLESYRLDQLSQHTKPNDRIYQ
jgi:flagellar export protein FliJ